MCYKGPNNLIGIHTSQTVILMGVPRGCIRGPLLFLIHMNFIPIVINYFTFILHADGTTLFINYSILLIPSNLKWTLINGGFLKSQRLVRGKPRVSNRQWKINDILSHDDVIKWKHFPRNWSFVRGIHRSRWIPHTKASDAELWCYLWYAPE